MAAVQYQPTEVNLEIRTPHQHLVWIPTRTPAPRMGLSQATGRVADGFRGIIYPVGGLVGIQDHQTGTRGPASRWLVLTGC